MLEILDLANHLNHLLDIIQLHYLIYSLVSRILVIHQVNLTEPEALEIVTFQENIEEHAKNMVIFHLKNAVIMVVAIEEMRNQSVIDQEELIKLNQEIMVEVLV